MRITGGTFKNRKLFSPKTSATRPTSERIRESLFNIVQGWIEGARVLDLFAGSGAVGIEALSWGAKHATFVDQHRGALQCIQKNLHTLNVEEKATLLPMDARSAVEKLIGRGAEFELIFVDPPYGSPLLQGTLEAIASSPLLAKGGELFIETAAGKGEELTIPEGLALKSKRKLGSTLIYQLSLLPDS